MNIFIDTNVLISFYGYSKDDLEELRKLIPIVENRSHKLLITQQLKDEFYRNREKKISETLNDFQRHPLHIEIPKIFQRYDEIEPLNKSMKESSQLKTKLIERLRQDVVENTLVADKIVEQLFSKGEQIEVDRAIVDKAQLRMQAGNPPGKGKSLGDAINWECLLHSLSVSENLHLVSQDSDYASDFDKSRLAQFLVKEWNLIPRGEIAYYTTLTGFFSHHFPKIQLANQLETELHIRELTNSPNFRTSRSYLKLLSQNESLSDGQIIAIVDAAITNNQISWIANDDDIKGYLKKIVHGHEGAIDEIALKKLNQIMSPEDEESDIPF